MVKHGHIDMVHGQPWLTMESFDHGHFGLFLTLVGRGVPFFKSMAWMVYSIILASVMKLLIKVRIPMK